LAGFVRCHYSCVFTSKQPNRADKKARCKVFAAFENSIHYILYTIQGFYLLEIKKKKILHIIPSHRLFEFAYKDLFGFGLVVLKLCDLKKLIILKYGKKKHDHLKHNQEFYKILILLLKSQFSIKYLAFIKYTLDPKMHSKKEVQLMDFFPLFCLETFPGLIISSCT
jgi:hypothetical protein